MREVYIQVRFCISVLSVFGSGVQCTDRHSQPFRGLMISRTQQLTGNREPIFHKFAPTKCTQDGFL
jgi:hypothetical protein